jgi:hypothetical protein
MDKPKTVYKCLSDNGGLKKLSIHKRQKPETNNILQT